MVAYLRSHGFPAAKRELAGESEDRGDITGIGDDTCLEGKDWKKIELSRMVGELIAEMQNKGSRFGCVVAKRAFKKTGEAYAVKPFSVEVETMRYIRELEAKVERLVNIIAAQ